MKQLVTNGKLVQIVYHDGNSHKLLIPESGSSGYKPTKFSAFRLVVSNTPSGSILQFSRLKFISDDGTEFNYCKNETPSITNITNYVSAKASYGQHGSSGEDPEAALLTESQKCCWKNLYLSTTPVIFTYTLLQNRTIDISIYNKWYWWSSNDTWTSGGEYGTRHLVAFKLQVSNDNTNWYTLDEQTNCVPLQKVNKTMAYKGNLVFPDVEQQI